MKRLLDFLTLGVIVPPLPFNILDGQLADAAPVMGNFNHIVAQVNANASPGGTAISQWQSIGVVPTFVNPNTLTLPGDLRGIVNISRRVQAVVTGGALVYGTVRQSVFGGGITTLTLAMSSGVLDAGLSALNYGIIAGNVNSSLPAYTNFVAGLDTQVSIPASATTIILQSAPSSGDVLNEWSIDANARFTPAYTANYALSVNGWIFTNGANVTVGQLFTLKVFQSGVFLANMSLLAWPFASGVQSNWYPFSGDYCPAGGVGAGAFIDFRITAPAFTTATPVWLGSCSIRRLPF